MASQVNNTSIRQQFNDYIDAKTTYYQKKYGFKYNPYDREHAFWNNEADAFKHAFMQAKLTFYAHTVPAKIAGDFHELEGTLKNQPAAEKEMDLWNNKVGRQIGREVKAELIGKEKLPEDKLDDIIAEKIMQKMRNGELITKPYTDNRNITGKAADIEIDPNAETPSLSKDPYIEQSKPLGTQNLYDRPDVNYDPTQRIYNRNGQILKPASTQGNQPPVASKPFGRQPVFQSPNNAAIGTALGGAAGAAVVGVAGNYLYKEAAKHVSGKIVGYACSIQGSSMTSASASTSAWSAATHAVSSAWSATVTAVKAVVGWIGGAISSAVSTIVGVIATAVTTAASAIGGAIMSAIAWIAALAFPW